MSYFKTSFGSLIAGCTVQKIAKRITMGDSFDTIAEEEITPIIGSSDFGAEDEAWEIFEHCQTLTTN